jgi:hypothetical protein
VKGWSVEQIATMCRGGLMVDVPDVGAVETLLRTLIEGESDDRVDVCGAIDRADPATRAVVAAAQRARIDASNVSSGAKFGWFGGEWRVVHRWVDEVDESAVDVFGGVEGVTTYYPQVEGG